MGSKICKRRRNVPPNGDLQNDPSQPKEVKLVLVGDTTVGKSCLIYNFLRNEFSMDYEPTVLEVYKGQKEINIGTAKQQDRQDFKLEIHDTSGDEMLI